MKMNKNEYQLTITAFEDLDSLVEVWHHGLDILKAFVDSPHRVLKSSADLFFQAWIG
jgi:hypothetical protein